MHTEMQTVETDSAVVQLLPNGTVQITHWSGAWHTFNPSPVALALCSRQDRVRVYVHCRLNALTGRRERQDTLRCALTSVEMYAIGGAP